MSYYVDNLWELRKARKIFKAKLDIAYRKCDLPEFVYQYCQWIISDGNNPLANMFWLDYNNAINLHQLRKCQSRLHSTASETAKHAFPALSDILPELIPTAAAFIGSTANPGKWNYRQFTPFDVIDLSSDAIDVADFKEKYMTAPSKVMKAGMSAPEIGIAKACIDNDLPGYAWWWSVWTITKIRGNLNDRYWDDCRKMSPTELYRRLKEYRQLFETKDSKGCYVYDVLCNPFRKTANPSGCTRPDFEKPLQPVLCALKCLEPFVGKTESARLHFKSLPENRELPIGTINITV